MTILRIYLLLLNWGIRVTCSFRGVFVESLLNFAIIQKVEIYHLLFDISDQETLCPTSIIIYCDLAPFILAQ